jgi:hypothetical protein
MEEVKFKIKNYEIQNFKSELFDFLKKTMQHVVNLSMNLRKTL